VLIYFSVLAKLWMKPGLGIAFLGATDHRRTGEADISV
jgi:hypothetical protein